MATAKRNITTETIDWYASFVAKVCPGLLELIGGGPAGPGGPGNILEVANAAQRKKILGGIKKIADLSANIQKQVK